LPGSGTAAASEPPSAAAGVAGLLENRREQVGTKARASGRADQPQLSTLEVVINLARNAFFRTILPGFDEAVRNRAGEPP
jgi:hypothetical protein